MEIKGKTVIITGTTGTLGSATVLGLAKAGADCICIYNKNGEKADSLGDDLNKIGAKRLFIKADLTRPDDIEKIFEETERFSPVDILINAAAVFKAQPEQKHPDDFISQIFAVNFFAAMNMAQKFAALVKKQNTSIAKIINMTDAMANNPSKTFAVYNASKAALQEATKQLAKQLAPKIMVNAVAPGIVTWPEGASEEKKQKILAKIPAGRIAKPDDIISAIKFLIQNDYITGQVITVDGGRWL